MIIFKPPMELGKLRDIPVFFIIGNGRSGTTMLRSMLNAHPGILIPVESKFFIHLNKKYRTLTLWNEKTVDSFCRDLFFDPLLDVWNIDRTELRNDLLRMGAGGSFAFACKIVISHFDWGGRKDDFEMIGLKNPINTLFCKELLDQFNDAKFIHLVRDPRANIRSHIKNFGRGNYASMAHRWRHYISTALDWQELHPQKVHLLRYEDLVRDPAGKLEDVCRFLGIQYSPVMLQFHKAFAGIEINKDNLLMQRHKNLTKPVTSENLTNWKKNMNHDRMRLVDLITGRIAAQLGYEVLFRKFTFEERIKSAMGYVLFRQWLAMMKTVYHLPTGVRNMLISYLKVRYRKRYRSIQEIAVKIKSIQSR